MWPRLPHHLTDERRGFAALRDAVLTPADNLLLFFFAGFGEQLPPSHVARECERQVHADP